MARKLLRRLTLDITFDILLKEGHCLQSRVLEHSSFDDTLSCIADYWIIIGDEEIKSCSIKRHRSSQRTISTPNGCKEGGNFFTASKNTQPSNDANIINNRFCEVNSDEIFEFVLTKSRDIVSLPK